MLLRTLIASWVSLRMLDRAQTAINAVKLPSELGVIPSACLSKTKTLRGADLRILFLSVVPGMLTVYLVPDTALRELCLVFCACLRVVDQPTITDTEIAEGKELGKTFVLQWRAWAGPERQPPNIHLFSHIFDSLQQHTTLAHTDTWQVEQHCRKRISVNTNGHFLPITHMRAYIKSCISKRPAGFIEGAELMDDEDQELLREIARDKNVSTDDAEGAALLSIALSVIRQVGL